MEREPMLLIVEGIDKLLNTDAVRHKGVAWTLKHGDQIFMKDTKYENEHPFYKSAQNRLGRSRWFKFEVEETEMGGMPGLLLTCTSTIQPKATARAQKPVDERKPITRAQWADAMKLGDL